MSEACNGDYMGRRILIAGIGNIFLGDDGFGVEVIQHLRERHYPQGVQMIDFGIRGIELAYTLLEGYDTLILIDATPRGNEPGTLYLIDPDLCDMDMRRGVEAGRSALDAHSMDPLKVLSFARTLGAVPRQTFLVGCEPSPVVGGGPDTEMQIGLSPAVHLALAGAVKMIDALVAKLLRVEA